jgi:predicted phosphodiesterase
VPTELRDWQLEGGLVTASTQRLVQSAFDTYATSKVFYRDVVHAVTGVAGELHRPADGQTVALLVSDRHDNIGMDAVARAVGDAGGATVVIDAGDDTSVGQPWESFSLDSLDAAFHGYTKVAISGNHDHGKFVNKYLEHRGWTHLDGHPVSPFADVEITGVDDPRSSGLGGWRDETNLTFAEVKATIGKDVCDQAEKGKRIATLIVHDANLGGTALASGCTDLVVAGHLHVQKGPTRVVGANGEVGYSYTNGTTGGAAYALAYGSKLKRDAEVTLLTFEHGRPAGIQPVQILTTGEIRVSPYVTLDLG